MKTFIQIFLFPYIFLFGVHASAQKRKNDLKLSITIADKTVDTIRLNYYPPYGSYSQPEQIIDCRIKDGKFDFDLKNIAQTGYFQLTFHTSGGYFGMLEQHSDAEMISAMFLAEAGDDIKMDIGELGVTFSGKGAEKYNCIVKVLQERAQLRKSWPKKEKRDDLVTETRTEQRMIKENSLKILETYKSKLSPLSYAILKLDYQVIEIHGIINTLSTAWHRNEYVDYVLKNQAYFSLKPESPLIADRSMSYVDFLFTKEQALAWKKFNADQPGAALSKEKFIKFIADKYEVGALRDKLLSMALLDADAGYGKMLKQTLSLIHTKSYKDYLVKNDLLIGKGNSFFDFHLQDTLGRTVNLKDLRGKVVVVDFFFTGCTGCVFLTKAMTSVIDEFKDNPEVVFVSIDVDKKKEMFLAATKNRKYTHAEAINLYTNGQGEEHELIKYYGFQGYPQLFLLDKKGNILFGNPPRPGLDQSFEPTKKGSTGEFIKIIKDYLAANPSAKPAPIKMSKN
ncbi:TlpA family protein disulfide reductase [Pedobacter nutrimenti]|uniref:Peroxiredoxin n=1 Tax=Pedobacter nutrimenti TaxID=1241337 RepID=A0A318UCK0_9SPHI|nr:TlpA disulfide reductase family protein [Pedobacter nutrimenti]PYF74104.1 peroxiredoxin [Pedobacter nutrimenti]